MCVSERESVRVGVRVCERACVRERQRESVCVSERECVSRMHILQGRAFRDRAFGWRLEGSEFRFRL